MAADSEKIGSEGSLRKELASGKLSRAYLLFGPETNRIKKSENEIRKLVEKDAEDISTAWASYDLVETGFGPFLSDIKTVSFFGGTRAVAAHNFGARSKDGRSSGEYMLEKDEQDELLAYLEKPSIDVVLILRPAKINGKLAFWKEVKKRTVAVSFETSKDEKQKVILERIKSGGLVFSQDARSWMRERFSESFAQLDSEMDKLEAYVGEKKSVELEDLEACMSAPKIENIWALTRAVGEGNIENTLSAISSIKKQGEEPYLSLPLIARQFRILLICKECIKKGQPVEQIAELTGVNQWLLNKEYLQQAKKYPSIKSLKQIMVTLSKADIRIKSSGMDSWMVFEEEIISLFAKKMVPSHPRYAKTFR